MVTISSVLPSTPLPTGRRRAAALAPVLRPAVAADVPALLRLHRASLQSLARGYYTKTQLRSLLAHVPTLDAALITDRSYLVAEIDGALVACGGWSFREPGYAGVMQLASDTADVSGTRALIRAMYTHPDWARRGLARRILRAAEAAALRLGATTLELDALLPGLPLYRTAGYATVAARDAELPDGERMAVVTMRKSLASTAAGTRGARR
jgi:GNAT superfamily N-acetyltransferase